VNHAFIIMPSIRSTGDIRREGQSIAEKWRRENPDFVKNYTAWINDLSL
jgi:hypothetical protein